MIVAVDPGIHDCGVSVWRPDGQLFTAGLVNNPIQQPGCDNAAPMSEAVRVWLLPSVPVGAALAIEVPQVYTRTHSKGDPNDLIDLACVVGAVMGLRPGTHPHAWTSITAYRPAQWKGNVPKDVTTERALRDLSAVERLRVQECAPSLLHNVWDAVALGLAHLKKIGIRK
jgi:hypothetical protein